MAKNAHGGVKWVIGQLLSRRSKLGGGTLTGCEGRQTGIVNHRGHSLHRHSCIRYITLIINKRHHDAKGSTYRKIFRPLGTVREFS